jgi:hypothetical protein
VARHVIFNEEVFPFNPLKSFVSLNLQQAIHNSNPPKMPPLVACHSSCQSPQPSSREAAPSPSFVSVPAPNVPPLVTCSSTTPISLALCPYTNSNPPTFTSPAAFQTPVACQSPSPCQSPTSPQNMLILAQNVQPHLQSHEAPSMQHVSPFFN